MKNPSAHILCLSGLDPTGGAGLQADIEAIGALGGHALPVLTANTVQDTDNVRRVVAVPPILIADQLETLAADCRIDAVKIGLLGDAAQLDPILALLARLPVPVVLDPVLSAGGGTRLVGAGLRQALIERLLPRVTIATPNLAEARQLTGLVAPEEVGEALLELGLANALVTGGDEPGAEVRNRWHRRGSAPQVYDWPRLPQRFHGAGCTLAAALAALLARQQPLAAAIEGAQRYTHGALERAWALGGGRLIPGRREA
jgi:hydroxymethylpyrimidine/phosphomethylpyrimidine kinase